MICKDSEVYRFHIDGLLMLIQKVAFTHIEICHTTIRGKI